jgi:hypothetical protein
MLESGRGLDSYLFPDWVVVDSALHGRQGTGHLLYVVVWNKSPILLSEMGFCSGTELYVDRMLPALEYAAMEFKC